MGGTSQPWMGSQQPQPSADPSALQPSQKPATTGYSTDISSSFPAAYPINGPAPGTVDDLQARAAAAPQQLGQALQNQQQPQPQPGQWSDNNPYAPIAKQYQDQWQAMQPKPDSGGGVKRFLSSFFQGMGGSMMLEAGLTPPNVRRDQIGQHMTTMMQLANQWEDMQGIPVFPTPG